MPHFANEYASELRAYLGLKEDPSHSVECNPRIKLVQRTKSRNSARRFTNLDDVIQLLNRLSSEPVQIVTTNSDMTVEEQAMQFQSDILVTPHGSQVVNLLWAHPSTVAVEVGVLIADDVFGKSTENLIRGYIFSEGHIPVGPRTGEIDKQILSVMKNECTNWDERYGGNKEVCEPLRVRIRDSDMVVDLDRLEQHILMARDLFCSGAQQ
eukprot:Clim_evm32s158 gene=Clim_evmTU32s158